MSRPRALKPGPGQESVWDYPRPPALRPVDQLVTVVLGGVEICETQAAIQYLETSHPPTYYLPRDAFVPGSLREAGGSSFCEWKGEASYVDLVTDAATAPRAGWTYPQPARGFEALVGHIAVMPSLVDACFVDGERVVPQEGGFYGGWVTSRVVGPFKGVPGSWGW